MSKRKMIRNAAIVSALMAIVLLTAWQPTAAQQRGGAAQAGANGDVFATMCRAAGGNPVWTTSMDSTGHVTYIVECEGGYLGGLNCIFDEGFSSCTQARKQPTVELPTVKVVEIAPVDDPVQPQVIETVVVDPNLTADEPTTDLTETATPEPTVEPTTIPSAEPIVDDGSVVIVDPVALDGNDLPELQTGPELPEFEPITPIEVVTLQ